MREARLLYHDLMEVVLKEIGAGIASVAVIDGKEAALRPSVRIFVFRPGHIEDDRNSVFIVVPLNSLMGIC